MDIKKLAKNHNLEWLEMFSQSVSSYSISFVANKLKQTEISHHEGKAIRLLDGNRIGFSSVFGDSSTEDAISKAKQTAKFYPELELDIPSQLNLTEKDEVNGTSKDLILQTKENGKEIINYILSSIGSDSALLDLSYDISNITEKVENSKDLFYSSSRRIYSFSINLRETIENDFIEIFTAKVEKTNFDHIQLANEIIDLYKNSKKHIKINSGYFPVLFTSKATKELFSVVELALSGKNVNQKSSPWHNKLEKAVLSPKITLKQDPGFGYMARTCDDEGIHVKPLILIENGILKNFYFDLASAHNNRANQFCSTGNGFRNFLNLPPEPSSLNLIVLPGKRNLAEILKNIDYGLLVDQTIGGLSTNISGDLSINIDLGFLIEKGEIVGRVKDTMVSGNIYNALNNVIELSSSPKWYWSETYSPDILVEGLSITASE